LEEKLDAVLWATNSSGVATEMLRTTYFIATGEGGTFRECLLCKDQLFKKKALGHHALSWFFDLMTTSPNLVN
jgi:hypothetical protein